MGKIKKIVFIVSSIFNQRDYKRYGLDVLLGRGYKVEVWDLSPLLRREYNKKFKPHDIIQNKSYLHQIKNRDQLNILKKQASEDTFYIFMLSIQRDQNYLLSDFATNNFRYGFVMSGSCPTPSKFSMLKIYLSQLKKPRKLLVRILAKNKARNICIAPSFIISGGIKSTENLNMKGKVKEIKAHTYDYDIYLDLEKCNHKPKVKNEYALFIDQCLPFHPDFIGKDQYEHDATMYYDGINMAFQELENTFGYRIIIAAHPRFRYRLNPFKGREIFYDKTANLIKYSNNIILHYSTAVNFCVCYTKPLIFLTSKNYKIHLRTLIETNAKELGYEPIEINNIKKNNIRIFQPVKPDLYETYKTNYIKESNTPKIFLWEIFADFCDSYAQN